MAAGTARITTLTFPADDAVFAARVRQIVGSAPDEEAAALRYVIERLHPLHPEVSARFRIGLAGFGDRVLYVFRDGAIIRDGSDEDWLHDPATARVVTDAAGTYVDANAGAEHLFGLSRDEIVGAAAGSFTRPDVRIEDRDALWRALDQHGRFHSLAILACPDGTEESVEFVTVRDGDGPGLNVTYLRPIE